MSIKSISILVIFSLTILLSTQVYLVYEYFQTTKNAIVHESDAVILEAFRQDLTVRNKLFDQYLKSSGKNSVKPTSKNTFKVDLRKSKLIHSNLISALDQIINNVVSEKFPVNEGALESVVQQILLSKGIHSKFIVEIFNPLTGGVLSQTKSYSTFDLFRIESKPIYLDMEAKKALRLVLINPFDLMAKRMSWMLLSSFVFVVICLLAFRYLLKVLARQKQLVAFKNEFLSSIAHELKRPVASLTLNLDCLGMPGILNNPKQHEQLLYRSVNATTEMNHTILMIVSLARAEEGLLKLNKSTVQLDAMLEELKTGMESGASKPVQLHLAAVTPGLAVTADEQLLRQCFANLIDNAIKYSGPKVEIDITIRQQDSGVVVAIKDNGLGIPADKLPHIFEKYNRVHTGDKKISGFGIGLNYVKTIVEKHNGRIEVSSEENSGSEFRVWLPA